MSSDNRNESLRRYFRKYLPSVVIFFIALALVSLGLVTLFSVGRSSLDHSTKYLFMQMFWLGLSLSIFWVVVRFVNLDNVRDLSMPLGVFFLICLALVLIPGVGYESNGARRWFRFWKFGIQISEFSKISLILWLSHYLSHNQRHVREFLRGFVYPLLIIGIHFGLIILEPDFGTAFLVGTVGFILLFLNGARLIYLIPTILLGLAGFSLMILNDEVRLKRILSFLDLEGNRSAGAYQLWQGLLGFASGGFSGIGVGNGRQQLFYLPEAHTDFIFPVIGEELGFLASSLVLAAFMTLFLVVVFNLKRAPNPYSYLLVSGAILFIVIQSLINMAVVTGSMPTKGMSLPFISYGGSNLMTMFIMLGIIVNQFKKWSQSPLTRAREVRS